MQYGSTPEWAKWLIFLFTIIGIGWTWNQFLELGPRLSPFRADRCASANLADRHTTDAPRVGLLYYVEDDAGQVIPCNSDWTEMRR